MRWFLVLFVLGSLPLFAGEAGDEGLEFLKSLREPKAESEVIAGLGISPYCGPRKLEVIKKNWQIRAEWARKGSYRFEVLEEKVDDDLAGVLVAAATPDSPFLSQVISLALVRKDEGWKVAPVEGRFENTGLGFEQEVNGRADALELWMARERVGATSQLQASEWKTFRKTIEGSVPKEDLGGLGPKEVLARFLAAAKSGDTDAALVWQGFLERENFPERDWERDLGATRAGVAGDDEQNVWRLLTSGKVMKVIMDSKEETDWSQEILVGFLSSYETGTMNDTVNPVRFQVTKTPNGWRVELPVFFAFANEDDVVFRNARNRAFDWQDRTGVQKMFEVFESGNAKIRDKEAKAVVDGLVKDLAKGDLETFLCRQYRFVEEKKEDDDDADDDAENDDVPLPRARFNLRQRGGNEADQQRRKLYEEAVKWWSTAHEDRETSEAELSKFYADGPTALAILALPPSADTWKPRYLEVWLGRDDEGWMILPGQEQPLAMTYPEERKEVVTKLGEQFAKDQEEIFEDFLSKVLEVVGIDSGEEKPASEEVARKLVEEWREIARTGGMMDLLRVSAVGKLPEQSKDLLRDLGYVRKEAAAAEVPDQFLGSRVAGRYRAFSLMVDRGIGEEMKCPLVIVVPVKDGYRVLVDVELPLETNRGLSMLNEDRLENLGKKMSEEDFARVQELRKWHQETARPVWEKWRREKEAQEN